MSHKVLTQGYVLWRVTIPAEQVRAAWELIRYIPGIQADFSPDQDLVLPLMHREEHHTVVQALGKAGIDHTDEQLDTRFIEGMRPTDFNMLPLQWVQSIHVGFVIEGKVGTLVIAKDGEAATDLDFDLGWEQNWTALLEA